MKTIAHRCLPFLSLFVKPYILYTDELTEAQSWTTYQQKKLPKNGASPNAASKNFVKNSESLALFVSAECGRFPKMCQNPLTPERKANGDDIMQTVLIVEDDQTIRRELEILLEKYGYAAKATDDFSNAAAWILQQQAHLVLLDINLPYCDGLHICREIRKNSAIPIIIVTSRSGDVDELMGMSLGADDFVRKPYNIQVLLARIENVLRRASAGQMDDILRVGEIALNLGNGTISLGKQSLELTKNELRVLRLLMKNQGKIVSREQIMLELWQSDEFVDDNTLTVNIGRLRKKLGEIGAEGLIQTKRGQGYML
jgi:DNA-binding response OmpR family regulator